MITRCQVCGIPIDTAGAFIAEGDHDYCSNMCFNLRITQERIDDEGENPKNGRRNIGDEKRKPTPVYETEFPAIKQPSVPLGTVRGIGDE